jgi:protein-disulfide isomerase
MQHCSWRLAAGLALFLPLSMAQAEAQSAPATEPPSAPTATPAAEPFPKPDPRNFTAETPTVATVDTFLKKSWGYDPKRIWQVEEILKTPVAGVSKVVVFVTEKGSTTQPQSLQFFTLPDGKHIIADDVVPFGDDPFADNRALLVKSAHGPWRGAAQKDLQLVEFADYQCPHCKDVQETMEKLLTDFPNAHFVYQNYPLVQIHSEAYKASAYSLCVAKLGSNDAFFKFSSAVYAAQASLTPEGSDQALKDAVTKVGLDPEKVAACSNSAEIKASVDESIKLGTGLGVNSTPTLFVNGRGLPVAGIPYEQLKDLISFEASQDGPLPK